MRARRWSEEEHPDDGSRLNVLFAAAYDRGLYWCKRSRA